jgi:lipoprotein-releasing system ATP-binding protein
MEIRVRGLWKVFETDGGRVEALKGIDLDIPDGEMLAIIGVSIGKSTLLHILGTLDQPSAGEVHYGDINVFKQNDSGLASFRNREIGFVFQFHYLLPEFTALENVMMPCLINGLSTARAREMSLDILKRWVWSTEWNTVRESCGRGKQRSRSPGLWF